MLFDEGSLLDGLWGVGGGVDQWYLFPFQRAIKAVWHVVWTAGPHWHTQFDLNGQKPASVAAGQRFFFNTLCIIRSCTHKDACGQLFSGIFSGWGERGSYRHTHHCFKMVEIYSVIFFLQYMQVVAGIKVMDLYSMCCTEGRYLLQILTKTSSLSWETHLGEPTSFVRLFASDFKMLLESQLGELFSYSTVRSSSSFLCKKKKKSSCVAKHF